ncbi:ankyrin repeat, SAM and basic leucine zipper domain-containing protein 1 [Chelmon rostratus]|uniref:ankyrin repeat, SAM and basic leucine zipper domain-containing protein 1 n=1 Tax=Chelmon rostratus TaxID=109905 RepID=UPI001BE56314|nr:ankyrin repeat, SAM and basic leucine zipper domain-containing protein 1 [Chelmon rostratus]
MDSRLVCAIPAGYESDSSCDEWDIGISDKYASCIKDLNAVSPHAEDDVSMLKTAICQGDIRTVERLLDNGMDVETRLGLGWTPLMYVFCVANYDMAKLLLDRGASANFVTDDVTVLMASVLASASEDKIASCVGLLLSRGADPNIADRCQITCLMRAAQVGYCKVINLLVSHGAELNVQNMNGYSALSIAVQYGRKEAVLKLLQLGADKTIRTNSGKSPAELAVTLKHTEICKILAFSPHVSTTRAVGSMEETLSEFFKTNSKSPPSMESVTKLDELGLLLHGLDLGYLTDIMTENDITWSYLLTMEKEDLEKIGITDAADQQKLLIALQQIHMDKVDLDTICQLGVTDTGTEELLNFLISVRQQCCHLTESIQDVISRFPCRASQLVFSPYSNKEVQAVCNQLVIQTKDLQMEVTCLRGLLCQINKAEDCCQPPRPGSRSNWRMRSRILGVLGATFVLLLCKAARGKVYL